MVQALPRSAKPSKIAISNRTISQFSMPSGPVRWEQKGWHLHILSPEREQHMDLKPAPAIVSERLKSQFAPAYLTLTSIIQGVALAVLAARVEATYMQFDATDWTLTTATWLAHLGPSAGCELS